MNDGKNITELLKGGIWLQAGAALSDVKPLLAHGPQKASDLAQSGALKNASTYFNNLVATNLINNYFREAGAHIVFVRAAFDAYGQHIILILVIDPLWAGPITGLEAKMDFVYGSRLS